MLWASSRWCTDNFTVVLDVMGKQQMVYKHAISTITPAKAVNFMSEKEEG